METVHECIFVLLFIMLFKTLLSSKLTGNILKHSHFNKKYFKILQCIVLLFSNSSVDIISNLFQRLFGSKRVTRYEEGEDKVKPFITRMFLVIATALPGRMANRKKGIIRGNSFGLRT